jgi:hypothetical protein
LLSLSGLAAASPLAAVMTVALAVNWPTIHDYFHGDDFLAFIDMVNRPTLTHIWESLTFRDANVYWRPLGDVYYLLIWRAFGLSEVAYHLANIGVFLVTLWLLYLFCVKSGLGRGVGLLSAAVLTLFPNHVVSVSWITNGPRLLAVMLALASLVFVQQGMATRRWRYDALAVLCMGLAALADETSLSLAPLPVAYAFLFDERDRGWLKRTAVRAVPYAALALTLIPLQFASEKDPAFSLTRFGWHMPEHFWALMAKLVLPVQDGIAFANISEAQWVAGAAGIAGLTLMLVLGSDRLRFLAGWVVLGLAPFTLWVMPIAPARYVYMGAVPFAVIAAWALVALAEAAVTSRFGRWARRSRTTSLLAVGSAAVALVFLGSIGASVTIQRDEVYARDTESYRVLAKGLKSAAPTVPQGARIVIYYGIWTGLAVWPDAVAETIYRDKTVHVVNVPRGQVESYNPRRGPKDVVLFYTGKGFIRAADLQTSSTP